MTIFQFISISVALVGLLFILESIVLIGGKGVDINGELPYMFFGTLFVSALPVILNLLGPWQKSWYWYVFIGFLMLMGFMSYVRSRGYTIRNFGGRLKTTLTSIEKALKQSQLAFEKTSKTLKNGTETHYAIGGGKYPIVVTEKGKSIFYEAYIEIVAPEALWNKSLQLHLMTFVAVSRESNQSEHVFRGVLRRLLVGIAALIFGIGTYF